MPLFLFLLMPLEQHSSVSADAPMTLTCGVPDAQTVVRNSAGYTAILKMHSQDDHNKDTHLCEADYTLETIRPNGVASQSFPLVNSDDAWDRPIEFRIEGFSPDGARVFVFLAEGNFPGWLDLIEYDMKAASRFKDVSLEKHFTRRLSRPCYGTLHIVGTSKRGRIVLGTSSKEGCAREELWELSPNRTTGPRGGAVLAETPEPLLSPKGIVPLEPGTRVQPELPEHPTN